jgi:hypothetical protein
MTHLFPLWTAVIVGAGFTAGCSSASTPAAKDSDSGSLEAGRDAKANDSGGSADTGAKADAGDSGSMSALQWYTTCGYPVCDVGADAGEDAAPGDANCESVGAACSSKGDTCGTATNANCGVTLVCDDQDPKGPGDRDCPISSRAFKDGIQYVSDAELRALHDEALGLKLATYNYKPQVADPKPKHVGFIIEDNPESVAVDSTHSRVDLYGYVSMVVAGMQVQEKEIAELKKELEASRREALGRARCAHTPSSP